EHLESFPDAPASLAIGTTRIEIQQVKDNQITSARCWQAARTTRS
ncbi:MAG: magnesium/cobalt efflux protein, partial [Cobetia sp.]